jgi:hypothetical protein
MSVVVVAEAPDRYRTPPVVPCGVGVEVRDTATLLERNWPPEVQNALTPSRETTEVITLGKV